MNRRIFIGIIAMVFAAVVGMVFATRELLRFGAYGAKETDVTCVEGTVEYHENEESSIPYLIKRLPDGSIADDFKIISTTDMHLSGVNSDFTLEILGRFIDKEKPDLVVLCGDNIAPDKEDLTIQRKLKELFEKKKVYWTFVLGNHDGECNIPAMGEEEARKRAFLTLSDSPYCLARDEGGDGVFGYGNHVLNIKNSSGVMQTLFFLDSGREMIDRYCEEEGVENIGGYDFIKQNQMTWYYMRLQQVYNENNFVLPKSMVFTHIAMYEYKEWWHRLLKGDKEIKRLYGDVWEHFGCAPYSSGFVDLLIEQGSTHTVVVGHDHVIGVALESQGLRLTYSLGLPYETYNRRHRCTGEKFFALWNTIDKRASFTIDGVTAYRVNADGSVDIMPKYAQYEGVFDGLEDELANVCGGNRTYHR